MKAIEIKKRHMIKLQKREMERNINAKEMDFEKDRKEWRRYLRSKKTYFLESFSKSKKAVIENALNDWQIYDIGRELNIRYFITLRWWKFI